MLKESTKNASLLLHTVLDGLKKHSSLATFSDKWQIPR